MDKLIEVCNKIQATAATLRAENSTRLKALSVLVPMAKGFDMTIEERLVDGKIYTRFSFQGWDSIEVYPFERFYFES